MSIKNKIVEIINFIEDLFLKNHKCICCKKEIPDSNKRGLCEKCFSKVEVFAGDLCSKCGEVVAGNLLCDSCKDMKYNFDENHSYAVYDEITGTIIKSLKYSGNKYISKYIASMISENKKYFEKVDYITFVPISRERLKERGFNQAEEIANEVSKILNIRVLSMLDKVKENTHQAGLSRNERISNIIGTIEIKKDISNELKGKSVMIVDDVFTTGSTLSECAKVLKANGVARVKTMTFAKTRQNMVKNG